MSNTKKEILRISETLDNIEVTNAMAKLLCDTHSLIMGIQADTQLILQQMYKMKRENAALRLDLDTLLPHSDEPSESELTKNVACSGPLDKPLGNQGRGW